MSTQSESPHQSLSTVETTTKMAVESGGGESAGFRRPSSRRASLDDRGSPLRGMSAKRPIADDAEPNGPAHGDGNGSIRKRRRKRTPKPEKEEDVPSPPEPTLPRPLTIPKFNPYQGMTPMPWPSPHLAPLFAAAAAAATRPSLPPATQLAMTSAGQFPLGAFPPGFMHHSMYTPYMRVPYPFPLMPPVPIPQSVPPPIAVPVLQRQRSPNPNSRTLGLPAVKAEQVDSGFLSDQSATPTMNAVMSQGERGVALQAADSQQEENESGSSSGEESAVVDKEKAEETQKESEEEKAVTPVMSSQPPDATALLFSATECHLATLQDDDGDTPLHLSVVQENTSLTTYLVSLIKGAKMNVDIYNYLRQTPLHLAVLTNQPESILMLIRGGANVNLPDRMGRTCVHQAVATSSLPSLQAIAQAVDPAPDLEIKNFDGFTALHASVGSHNLQITEFLLELGANINAKDGKSGATSLHMSVETENIDMLKFLIYKSASVDMSNFAGSTALHVAVAHNFQPAVKALLDAGANVKVANLEGFMPADLASNIPMKQLLRTGDKRKA